ncbi:hypothetical protein [Legionella londiniensis]|uniref:Transmembrane protein n=2 Tax=Legionella londiniensis TaxID=45068 RepID=A0A0W0VP68_9GAMM|nr:hypothetical protein [Legionella londiniensis]KTD21574.1 hypothetical protein Llon_0739 [Legionella londiniensis]STX92749.1 Uncharacterised protein [Legionella londiniensis]
MKDSNNFAACAWAYRFEILGLVLLFIATILTLITFNGIGIAAMFIVGAALCCHKCFSKGVCGICHPECVEEDEEEKSTAKKTAARKTTKI